MIDYIPSYDIEKWAEKIIYYATNKNALELKEKQIQENWKNITWNDTAKQLLVKVNGDIKEKIGKIRAGRADISRPSCSLIFLVALTRTRVVFGHRLIGLALMYHYHPLTQGEVASQNRHLGDQIEVLLAQECHLLRLHGAVKCGVYPGVIFQEEGLAAHILQHL